MRLSLGIAALTATFAAASPAFAQAGPPPVPVATSTAQAEARGVVLLPLTLVSTRDLDFGTVVASVTVAGSVTIDPDTGARTVGGGVLAVTNYPGSSALFQGSGNPNNDVQLTLNAPATLVHSSDPARLITVTSMAMDNGGGSSDIRTIDSSGTFSFTVGGEFAIAANQFPGLYAADFDVTAEYY